MDPVTALGAAGSVIGIAGFGLQVATTLQTYGEATLEADDRIRDIANDISATASALQRLQAVIAQDEKNVSKGRIFSVEGLKSVNKIALQCDVVFKRIVELLNKAGRPGEELSNSERAKDLKLSTLDHLKWPWLEPKITRCRQELERLLIKLLLMLQISNLASQQQLMPLKNHSHNHTNDKQLREVIAKLKAREERLTRSLEQAIYRPNPYQFRQSKSWKHSQTIDRPAIEPRGILPPKPDVFTREIPREVVEISELPEASSNGDKSGEKEKKEQGDVPKDKGARAVEFDENAKTTDGKKQAPPPEFPEGTSPRELIFTQQNGPLNFQQPPVPNVPVIQQFLEAYLLKGDQEQMLKVPLKQEELRKQKDSILAKNDKPIWDILMSLTPKHQASVNYAIDHASQKDNLQRILVAIEVAENLETSDIQHILLFLTADVSGLQRQVEQNRPTWTRMARRHLSIETLNHYKLNYQIDQDPDYVLIKRWVPEYEQEFLWNHTRAIRERRDPMLLIEDRRSSRHRRRTNDSDLELVIERKKKPSSILQWISGGEHKHSHSHSSRRKNHRLEEDLKHSSGPSPLLQFLAGGKREEVVDEGKVDDLLAKYTTSTIPEDDKQKKPDKQVEIETRADEAGEDKLGEEFLRTTRLDDYFSGGESDMSSMSSFKPSGFKAGWRRFWSALNFRRKSRRRRRGSVSTSSDSGSSRSLPDD